MTGKTHKAGGVLTALVGVQVLNSYTNLDSDISPLVQFLISYPFCMWGSTAPDLDHDWNNVEDKNPINFVIHRILHIFNDLYDKAELLGQEKRLKVFKTLSARHRSWQTHSDFTIVSLLLLRYLLVKGLIGNSVNSIDIDILALVLNGIILGTGVHLILDMFTRAGITLLSLTVIKKVLVSIASGKWRDVKPIKLTLVPDREYFSTDSNGKYERTVRKILQITTYVYTFLWVLHRYTNLDFTQWIRG